MATIWPRLSTLRVLITQDYEDMWTFLTSIIIDGDEETWLTYVGIVSLSKFFPK